MSRGFEHTAVLVPLSETSAAALFSLRLDPQESLDDVVARLSSAATVPVAKPAVPTEPTPTATVLAREKYQCLLLGELVQGRTLPQLFANVVNLVDQVAPEALEKLSAMRGNKRGFVSRARSGIHPSRPDLRVQLTSSGWWIDGNVGGNQVEAALRALCRAASLQHGVDIQFPPHTETR